jgi:hypothetical protein
MGVLLVCVATACGGPQKTYDESRQAQSPGRTQNPSDTTKSGAATANQPDAEREDDRANLRALPIEQRIVVLARKGEMLWKKSCAQQHDHLLCVSHLPQTAGAKAPTFHLRNQAATRNAESALKEALSLWKKAGGRQGRLQNATDTAGKPLVDWIARARLYLADRGLERYLQIELSQELTTDESGKIERKALGKMKNAIKKKMKSLMSLQKQYQKVMVLRRKEWALAAISRIALLYDELAIRMQQIRPPATLKTEKQTKLFAKTMAGYVDPLHQKTKRYYALCVATAKRFNRNGVWKKLCTKRHLALQKNGGLSKSSAKPKRP